jgi:hypothetical protein
MHIVFNVNGSCAATPGNYPDTSILLSTGTTVTPDAAPIHTTSINVSTSTSFKGTLEGDPTTGVVRVTDAHPAGTYTVTVRALNGAGPTATTTFTLTVTPATCTPVVTFGAAQNFTAGSGPVSATVGDFNGDSNQDLAVANINSANVSILLGDGAGSFSAPTNFGAGTGPTSVAVGDFNGDGNQDLAVANQSSHNVSILFGDGAGNFSAPTNFSTGASSNPVSVAVGDFNGDGRQDLAVASSSFPWTVLIFLGDGVGNFGAAQDLGVLSNNPQAVVVGDFNGDGNQDLAVANIGQGFPHPHPGNVVIFLGDGTGNFSASDSTAGYFHALAVGDFNGDGRQDLAVTSGGLVTILLGDGAGHFSTPTTFAAGGASVAVGDFNCDGRQDLATANDYSNNVLILLGDGAGNFGAPTNFDVGGTAWSVAVGDFNSDGKQDLAAVNSNNMSILLRICGAAPTPSLTPTPTPTVTPSPTPSITVTLPTANFLTSVPANTNIIQPVVTTQIVEQATTAAPNPEYPCCLENDPQCLPTIEVHHGLVGFQGDFTFKSSVVTFQYPYARPAGLTASNWNVSTNIIGTGAIRTLRISAYAYNFTPLNGSGTVFELIMRRVSSTVGATSSLAWAESPDNFYFIDGNLVSIAPNQTNGLITILAPSPTPTPTPTASPTPTPTVNISGTVVYCTNSSVNPMPGVTLTLTGSGFGSTSTDGSGNYLFSSLAAGGSYTVAPTKTARTPGSAGINTVDVIATQRHFLNVAPLPPGCPLMAADVNGDTAVTTIDVIAIQRFYIALPTGIANTGKYQFTPANRSYPEIITNQTGQNYDTLVFGDVVAPFVE